MSGHTPGPWRIDYGTFAVVSDHPTGHDQDMNTLYYNGHLVCESIKWEANARLIAASPELLGCLKEARKHLDNADIDLSYIDEVIAKAEGRT